MLHATFRLIMAEEDPFAIHLLIQSCDKIVTDYAEKSGKKLSFDFGAHVRPDKKNEAYRALRETYNYLKHADEDWDKLLEIRDLVRMNVLTMFVCAANFSVVFAETTDHMRLMMSFSTILFPEILNEHTLPDDFRKSMAGMENSTPAEFCRIVKEYSNIVSPNFEAEWKADTVDLGDFYETHFSELGKRPTPDQDRNAAPTGLKARE